MKFKVVRRYYSTMSERDTIFLTWNNWNDYAYKTVFGIIYIDDKSNHYDIGSVRIAHFGQTKEEKKLVIGDEFEIIGDEYFSLGIGAEYYENLNKLGAELRFQILSRLRDIALSTDILKDALNEDVTQVSLLRGSNLRTVKEQYRRIALGGAKLTKFKFWFDSPKLQPDSPEMKLSFNIIPESNPPTNVHVLIGRNGVGKTHMINNMIRSLYQEESIDSNGIYFNESNDKFNNVVLVSFSAFDAIKPHFDQVNEVTGINFKYIGLKTPDEKSRLGFKIKSAEELSHEFINSFTECVNAFKTDSLKKCLNALESDPNFKEENIPQLLVQKKRNFLSNGRQLFEKLSSGHKIILLSITKLVETIQEKSLVFIDEPEAHLHPPLLSAFIRALSELLIHINGVAIIATHSPVILQEVPKSCAYKLFKYGSNTYVERPEIETFGENVGTLT